MNLINRKPRILDRVLAGLTMLSLIISLSYGTYGAFKPSTVQAADLFANSFESGDFVNWTSVDNDWHISSGSGHEGSKKASVYGQGQEGEDVLKKAISTVGKTGLVLSYYYKTGQPIESTDHVYVEWTTNGTAWNQIADHKAINNGSWTLASYNLPSGSENSANFAFRFRATGLEPAQAQSGNDKDEFMIDSVLLTDTPVIVDADGDTVPDSADNCPSDANSNQADLDDDGLGDVCDDDKDGDTVNNTADNCPIVSNSNQANIDGDSEGDACDDDKDGDDVDNEGDNCPAVANSLQEDQDSDGIGDACDNDKDGDNVLNESDNCPAVANSLQEDQDSDGIGDACDDINDTDKDTIADSVDNCPAVANSDQADLDDDGLGDVCDDDKDGDTVNNTADNCPIVSNSNQANIDGDSEGDACDDDKDGDDVDNEGDNCPAISNSDQADVDVDEIGDVCDNDKDGDTVSNDADNCPITANQDQADTDADHIGNVCDSTPGGDEVDVCEDESATNYDEEGDCEYPSSVANTCLTPSAKGHDKAFTVGTSGETKLQDILTNAKYTVNVNSDQKNYQVWDFSTPNTDKVTFNVKILAKEAGNIETFGYYKAGDTSTFVPVFTIPPSSVGNTFAITVDSTFAASIGFAVQTSPLEPNTWYSEKALNTDGKDNVAVYNPSANTYVIAFEDLKNFDNDFNDLVVEVTAVTCVPEETKQCLVVSDATTLVDGVASTLTWVHPAWTTGLNAGTAEWIWDNTIAPRTGETVTFTKKFNVDNTPTGATLKVTADNSYTVSLNGNPLSCDGSGIDNFTSVDTCTATVLAGVNTLTFVAVNAPWDTDDVQVNPSGLIYELTINGSSCSPIPVEENPYGECISAENLLKNGSFEEPSIAEITIKWGPITDPLGWIVKKVADATNATLEFHRGVFGNEAAEGEQYVELDGEEADRISQTVTTEKGALYKLFWAFAPRLEYVNDASNQNQISVQVNGIQVATEGPATANFGVLDRQDWTRSSYQFTAKSENTEIAFADNGSPSDGYGAYLDNAYLCKVRNPVIDGGDTPTQVRGGGGALNRTGETSGDSDKREKKDTKDRDDKPSGDVEGVQTSKVPTVAGASTGAGGTSPSSPTNLPLMTLMTMLASVSTRGKVKINEK